MAALGIFIETESMLVVLKAIGREAGVIGSERSGSCVENHAVMNSMVKLVLRSYAAEIGEQEELQLG